MNRMASTIMSISNLAITMVRAATTTSMTKTMTMSMGLSILQQPPIGSVGARPSSFRSLATTTAFHHPPHHRRCCQSHEQSSRGRMKFQFRAHLDETINDTAEESQSQWQSEGRRRTRKRTIYTIDDTTCPPSDEDALRRLTTKHWDSLGRYVANKPLARHTLAAFREVEGFVEKNGGTESGIILDSGCGTGRSTLQLGRMYPNHIILGIDRSISRLSQNAFFRQVAVADNDRIKNDDDEGEPNDYTAENTSAVSKSDNNNQNQNNDPLTRTVPGYPNVLLVRAELSDFWRCCLDAKWKIDGHYLLYPNPYPKKARLKSRWYAHPSFPLLLMLGGDIVVRSNWEGYLREFASCVLISSEYLHTSGCYGYGDGDGDVKVNYAKKYISSAEKGPKEIACDDDESFDPMTNFEMKYFQCGEPMYELKLCQNENLQI